MPFSLCLVLYFYLFYLMLYRSLLDSIFILWKCCGTSLVVQWLRLRVPNARDLGSIPSQGTRFPHVATKIQHSQINKTNKQKFCCVQWVLCHFSHVQLFATIRTVARQAPLSMGFSRQEYWSRLPCPSPGNLPDPDIELTSLTSLH